MHPEGSPEVRPGHAKVFESQRIRSPDNGRGAKVCDHQGGEVRVDCIVKNLGRLIVRDSHAG